jgi:hypothetical protein
MMDAFGEPHVFVIKIWKGGPCPSDGLRASVLHVPSGRRLVSTELRDVEDFVRLRLEAGHEPD